MKKIYLSPSSLNLFNDCPRCFWLDKNKRIKRPRGIFPSLPGGMDLVIKKYFDKYRKVDKLPPEVKGRIEGQLMNDLALLETWRSWRKTNLCYVNDSYNAVLSGALDDCLVDEEYYIPLDYKTRGSQLKSDPRQYYQTQLDCYCLMLESNGYKTKGLSYLLYYWPTEVKENGEVIFHVEPIKIETNTKSAEEVIRQAALCLDGEIPEPSKECEYCNLVKLRHEEKI
jgi:hypothetical protein